MGTQMRRIMEASGQAVPQSKPVFEINVEHPLIRRLESEGDERRFGDLAGVLLDQARLAEGQQLEDPGTYARRLNRLLLELSALTLAAGFSLPFPGIRSVHRLR